VVLIVQEANVGVKEADVLMEVMIPRVVILKVMNFIDVLIVDKIIYFVDYYWDLYGKPSRFTNQTFYQENIP
jgi:hypothetical protein